MKRKPRPQKADPRPAWMVEQGNRCPCRGTDDMCGCQNETPWPRPALTKDDVRDLIAEAMTDRMDMDVGISELADAAADALIKAGYVRATQSRGDQS